MIQSSHISSISHDPKVNELAVEFKNGHVYKYKNVDSATHEKLVNKSSGIGSRFHTMIRSKPKEYPFEKQVSSKQARMYVGR